MPFTDKTGERDANYWDNKYRQLQSVIETLNNVKAERSRPLRGDIVKEIILNLLTADIVIADLTDYNPNVFWELGIRQSFKHRTITIAENGTNIPSNISVKGTLFYSSAAKMNTKFKKSLRDAIKDCIDNPNKPDSPVLEAITGRGSFHEIITRDTIFRRLSGLINEYNSNSKHYNHILKRIFRKKAPPLPLPIPKTNQGYPTKLFRTAALEALIVNRYLDNMELYRAAEDHYDDLQAINGRIILWPQRSNSIEVWLQKNAKRVQINSRNFLVGLKKATKDLKSKV